MISERTVRDLLRTVRDPLLLPACLALVVSPAGAQPTSSGHDLAGVATELDAILTPPAEAGLLSGVVLVARGGQVLFHRAYGFAGRELEVPNSGSTRFGVGSVTKAMTGIVVETLDEAGSLDLDAPVERYLPGFPRGPDGGAPTVRHLLLHRGGVPHRVTNPPEEARPLLPSDIVERIEEAGLTFEPGARRLYSSAGYTALARVVEVVEGRPFEESLAEHVFGPAGMTSSLGDTGEGIMPRRARPYRLGSDGARVVVKHAQPQDLRFLTGAGSVFATAEDLMSLARAIGSGVFGVDSREGVLGGDPDAWRGWAGRTNGYETSLDLLPSRDLTFVFVSNLRSAANWQARERIRALLRGEDVDPVPLPPPVAAQQEDPEDLVGSYGRAEITRVGGRLFRGENEFYPLGEGRYYIPASGTVMRFRRGSSGEVDAIVEIGADGEETVLAR